jgi:hypothetical protein
VDTAARNRKHHNRQRRSAELLSIGGTELVGAALRLRHGIFCAIINFEL